MPVGMLAQLPGVNAEGYDSVMQHLEWDTKPKPDGFISHHAGPTANGWLVFDVWESQGDFERFAQERLAPAMQGAFGEVPEMSPTFVPIHREEHA